MKFSFWFLGVCFFLDNYCFQDNSSKIVEELESSSVLNVVNSAKRKCISARAGNEKVVISTEDLQFLLEWRGKMGREM